MKTYVLFKENSRDNGRIVTIHNAKMNECCQFHFIFSEKGEFLRTTPLKKVEEDNLGNLVLQTKNSIYRLTPCRID